MNVRIASADDHPVRRHHEPDRDALGVAQELVHRDQVARRGAGRRPSRARPGSERSRNARASGRAAASSAFSRPRTRSSHQRAASGNESSRSVSPVGAQSTTIVSHSPRLGVALELEQAEQLVRAGRHGQLLGGDPLDAALGEQRAEPLLHGRPVALDLLLRLHLLRPHAAGRPRSARRPTGACSDSASECAGSVESTSVRGAGRGAAAGGGGGDRRLPHAALARVEDGPRAPSSPGRLRTLLALGLAAP